MHLRNGKREERSMKDTLRKVLKGGTNPLKSR